ncbi:MAG: hypothetical protein CML44_05955 [Rhodobacteraceae bacterium]|nr:hypothetical protein [Paracoccaceae bacterium]|tara:strand:- start:1284 stop:1805 length:522 start_codon:yes stop_codon:yes gene_type:complete
MDKNLIVIDNFLDNPDLIRQTALSLDYTYIQKNVPGSRSSKGLGGDLFYEIDAKFQKIFNAKIKWYWDNDTFYCQSCEEGTETWVHTDVCTDWAAVLYLTPYPDVESGTGIYHKDDDDEWEMNIAVGNVYNRLVAYRGKSLYHRSIVPGFGTTLETSRLTQVFFFDLEPNGQE